MASLFITKEKTNWKYLLILFILGAIVATATLWLSAKLEFPSIEFPEIKKPEKIKDETANWKIYRNEEYGFELKYPPHVNAKDWAEETPNMELLVNFGNISNISDSAVSVFIEEGTSIADLETEVGREDLFNNLLIKPEDIKDEKIGLDNYPAKKIDYKNKFLKLDFVEYLIDHSGLLYGIIYRRNVNGIISENQFNQMLSSFRFFRFLE